MYFKRQRTVNPKFSLRQLPKKLIQKIKLKIWFIEDQLYFLDQLHWCYMLLNTVVITSYQRQIQELHVSDEKSCGKRYSLATVNGCPKEPYLTYSTSDNEAPLISRVLIGRHLIFHSLTSPPCCSSPRKCTPVKYKTKQKARFLVVT